MSTNWLYLLAQAEQGAAQAPPPAWLTMLIMFGPIVVLFYLLILRPERKRQQERRRMLESLRKNARVVTVGGIKGVVTRVRDDEDEVEIRVDENTGTKLRVTKASIAWVETPKEERKQREQHEQKATGKRS